MTDMTVGQPHADWQHAKLKQKLTLKLWDKVSTCHNGWQLFSDMNPFFSLWVPQYQTDPNTGPPWQDHITFRKITKTLMLYSDQYNIYSRKETNTRMGVPLAQLVCSPDWTHTLKLLAYSTWNPSFQRHVNTWMGVASNHQTFDTV